MNASFFVRKNLVNALYSLQDLKSDPLLEKNKIFKDKHKGESIFILGSGHSIKTQDLKLLKGKIVMTQNHFHAHEDIDIIDPLYHVVVPKFHPKSFDKDWIDWLQSMEAKLPKKTQFFFGKNTHDMVEDNTGLGDRSHYVESGYHSMVMNKAKIDLTKRIMNVPTVITQCITIALYMGFEKIYLMGFDLDQLFQLSKGRDNVRFYGHSQITANEAEKKLEDAMSTNGVEFFNFWGIWKQLNLLKEYAEANGQQIINATNGGILNVYERQQFEQIISK